MYSNLLNTLVWATLSCAVQ